MQHDARKERRHTGVAHFCRIYADGEPEVEQGKHHGFILSWNPDDNRYYVHAPDEDKTVCATFKRWTNAVRWAKTHKVKEYVQ